MVKHLQMMTGRQNQVLEYMRIYAGTVASKQFMFIACHRIKYLLGEKIYIIRLGSRATGWTASEFTNLNNFQHCEYHSTVTDRVVSVILNRFRRVLCGQRA